MAERWIKVGAELHLRREVLLLSNSTGLPISSVVGLLVMFWSWVDGQTADGWLDGCTCEMLDSLLSQPGFSRQLCHVGWLEEDQRGLFVPRFDRHMGKSAKKRATDTRRKLDVRQANK